MDITIEVKGLDQLEKNLQALPIELASKALVDSLVAGGNVLAVAMAALVPVGETHDGFHIANEIVVQVEKHPVGSAAEVYVGPSKRVAYRARWQEFGTAAHAITIKRKKVLAGKTDVFGTKVEHPGERPRPFMRTALQAAGAEAVEAIKVKLADGIQKAAAKVNKK
jgi:HK97 gp10 family phage protein